MDKNSVRDVPPYPEVILKGSRKEILFFPTGRILPTAGECIAGIVDNFEEEPTKDLLSLPVCIINFTTSYLCCRTGLSR